MQNQNNLNKILHSILSKNTSTKEITEHKEIMMQLFSNLRSPTDLNEFVQCLQEQGGLKTQQILGILNQLIFIPQSRQVLKQKLWKQWLLFRIYEVMDILNWRSKAIRKNINDAFNAFQFSGKSIQNLIDICWKTANMHLHQQKVKDVVNYITNQHSLEINQLFQIKCHFDPLFYQEKLIDMITDFNNIPENIFEKQFQKELILAYTQEHPSCKETLRKCLPNLKLQKQKNGIEQLRAYYKNDYGQIPSHIEQLFNKMKENKSNADDYLNLCYLKSKICSINLPELQRLINKTKSSESCISNKEVLFFIGNTGSGKSTAILKFLGYNLRPGKLNGLSTLVPDKQVMPQHKTFQTSPEAKSCTRYINAVPIPDHLYHKKTPQAKKNLVICDSPGFGDSAGVQVDIANGVGMINALHKARSVRIVVILPFESFSVVGRMESIIKISDIISNLFPALDILYNSMVILFNKVPKQKTSQISKMVENKIQNLTEIQRSNHRLCSFLLEILKHSLDVVNFIDPIQGDFQDILQKIRLMQPIYDVNQFQYEFTDLTKKEIQNFARSSANKAKNNCDAGKLHHSYYHFKNLSQLKSILQNNNRIKQCYDQLSRYIQKVDEKIFQRYKQQVNSIVNCHQNSLKHNLKETRQKLGEFQRYFKNNQGLRIIQSSSIDQMVQDKSQELLKRFENILDITSETIIAAKIFSKELDPKIEQKILKILQKGFSQTFQKAKQQIDKNRYRDMTSNIQKIKRFQNLTNFITKLNVKKQISKLKECLMQKVAQGFDIISNIEKQFFMRSYVNKSIQKISQIKQIIQLQFLQNNQKVRKELNFKLANIKSRCQKYIHQIQKFNLSLQNSNVSFSKQEDQLSNKKNQIQLLMKISEIEQKLKEDYEYAIETFFSKLKENAQVVKQWIGCLNGNNIELHQRNIRKIEAAKNMIAQSCIIFANKELSHELTISIQEEFVRFLQRQNQNKKNVSLNLNQVREQRIAQIQKYYDKMYFYSKMKMSEEKAKNKIKELRKLFFQGLKRPFRQFKQLLQTKNYKQFCFILQKFQKLSCYALKMQQILSPEQYDAISEDQRIIIDIIEKDYNEIRSNVQRFIEYQLGQPQPTYIKQIIKNLLPIKSKTYLRRYLDIKINFQVVDNLNHIEIKLQTIKFDLQQHSENYQTQYRFYSQIQDVYRFKEGINQRFGFKNLKKNYQSQIFQNSKEEQIRIIEIIAGKTPSKINFKQLKRHHEKFSKLVTEGGAKKMKLITSQLGKIECKTYDNLKQYKNRIQDLAFIKDTDKLYDFMQCYSEAVVLETQLKQFYPPQERKPIFGYASVLKQINTKIYCAYSTEFQSLMEYLRQYDFVKMNQKLDVFALFQNMIFDLLSLDTKLEQQAICQNQLILFIKDKKSMLLSLIASHKEISQKEKKKSKEKLKLKNLLQILKKGEQFLTIHKYEDSECFTIDKDISKYYYHVQNLEQKRQMFQFRIKQHFDNLFRNYSIKWNHSQDQAQSLSKEIQNKITCLPPKMKKYFKECFDQLKKKLCNKNMQSIHQASLANLKNMGI